MLRAPARRSRLLTVLGLIAPSLVAVSLGAPQVEAGGTCALVPYVQGSNISQGLSTYTTLARNKTTLVHLYLSKPSCARSTDVLTLTSASVAVKNGTTQIGTGTLFSPTTPQSLPAYTTAAVPSPAPDNVWDPTLVVPGSVMTPCGAVTSCANTNGFSASFAVTLSFTANGVASTLTTTPAAVPVSRKSNAVRVLVQPMGDARQPFDTQYTAADDTIVSNGMQALARIYPVPDGVGTLAGSTGGVRYAVNPSLLDLSAIPGAYGADGKFCGGASTIWDGIRTQLTQTLSSWNSANPNQTADRIVGVIDSSLANGSNNGCFEGQGGPGTNVAWLQLFRDGSTPSKSGALFGMELTHTFALTKTSDNSYHSANTRADASAPGRAVNLTTRKLLSRTDNHSVMNFTDFATTPPSPWNQANTVLEQPDWDDALCALGGNTTTTCAVSGTTGTATGVAAGSTFYLSGLTGGTADSTFVTESYFTANAQQCTVTAASGLGTGDACGPDETSRYRVAFSNSAGQVTSTTGVKVVFLDEGHAGAGSGNGAVTTDQLGSFRTAVAGEAASTIGLYLCPAPLTTACKSDPRSGTALYVRERQDAPPTGLDTVVTPGGVSQLTTPDNYQRDGALSPNGQYVAFTGSPSDSDTAVYVAPVGNLLAAQLAPGSGPSGDTPTWSADGTRLAYYRAGGIVVQQVDTTATPIGFGPVTEVYTPRDAGKVLGSGALGAGPEPGAASGTTQRAVDALSSTACGYRVVHAGTTPTGRVRVTLRDRTGSQVWATDVPSSGGLDAVRGTAIGPDCSVWVSGTTTGTFAGQTRSDAGEDGMLLHLSPTGAVLLTRQTGLTRPDFYAGVDVSDPEPDSGDYEVDVVGTVGNSGLLARFDRNGAPLSGITTFGDPGTQGTGVAYSAGGVYLVGTTGTPAASHGVATRFDISSNAFSWTNADVFTATDPTALTSVGINGSDLWVGGSVTGALNGATSAGGTDVALAQLNPVDGTTVVLGQRGAAGDDEAHGLAVVDQRPVVVEARDLHGSPRTLVAAVEGDGSSTTWDADLTSVAGGLPAWGAGVAVAAHPVISGGTTPELWTGGADTTTHWAEVLLTTDPTGSTPTFSPDGNQLAFGLGDGFSLFGVGSSIAKVGVTGGTVSVLVPADGTSYGQPSWSHAAGVDRISFSGFALEFRGVESGGGFEFVNSVHAVRANGTGRLDLGTDLSEPSEGDDGTLLAARVDSTNSRSGLVRLSTTSGAPVPLTTGNDERPNGPSHGLVTFYRNGGLWALNTGTASTVTGRFTSTVPNRLRATLYYRCGTTTTVVAVGLLPSVSGSTATFTSRFDAGIACGSSNGQLFFAASDGIDRATTPPQQSTLVVPFKAPVAAIGTPYLGSSFGANDVLPLSGITRDAEDGVVPSLTWTVRSSSGGTLATGSGQTVDAVAPAGGWPGPWVDVVLTSTDSSGAVATATRRVTIADTSAPSLVVAHVPTGQAGFDTTTPVDVQITANDGSGVASVSCTDTTAAGTSGLTVTPAPTGARSYDGGVSVTGEGTHTVSCRATDSGGRVSAQVTDTVLVDTVAPTVTVTRPAQGAVYVTGASLTTQFSCADANTVTSCTGPATVDTTSGAHTATFTTADAAGNTRTVSVTYYVGWTFIGFQQPVDNPPTVNTGKAGRTYPLKWQLKDAGGAYASSLANIKGVTYTKVSCTSWAGNPLDALPALNPGSAGLSYDTASSSYQYNWKTPTTTGCYVLSVTLNDGAGTSWTAKFNLS